MADEEKQEETQSGTEQASDAAKETGTEPTENFEQMYKDQQVQLQEAAERAAKSDAMLDTLNEQGAIDWNALSGQPAKAEDDGSGEMPISKAEFDKRMREMDAKHKDDLTAAQFRSEHPELREYEQSLIIPKLRELRRKFPSKSGAEILKEAAKSVNDFIETERAKGRESVKAETDKKTTEAAAAGGLSSAATTSQKATSDDNEPQSYEDYIAERKAQNLKLRGIV